jgi:hypothetical protein
MTSPSFSILNLEPSADAEQLKVSLLAELACASLLRLAFACSFRRREIDANALDWQQDRKSGRGAPTIGCRIHRF